jgi:hypothetical protein
MGEPVDLISMRKNEPYSVLRDPNFWASVLGDQSEIPVIDFHESIEGASYVWALGNIILEFNYAEHQLKVLLWNYLGKEFDAGHVITQALGSTSVVDILRDSVRRAQETSEVVDLVEFAAKSFDICRDNRNALAHSMTLHAEDDLSYWIRPSRRSGFDQSQVIATIEELLAVSLDIKWTADLLLGLSLRKHMLNRGQTENLQLPSRFPIPKRLKSKHLKIREEARRYGLDLGDDKS